MKHRLGICLFLYFSVTILAFALILGGLFHMLFLRYLSTHQTEELRHHAQAMAMVAEKDPRTSLLLPGTEEARSSAPEEHPAFPGERAKGMHHGMHRKNRLQEKEEVSHGTYCRRTFPEDTQGTLSSSGRFLKELNVLAHGEVWLVDSQNHSFCLYGSESATSYDELPDKAIAMLDGVLRGETAISEDFSPLLTEPSITIGVPLWGRDGDITGALLLHRKLKDFRTAQNDSLRILALSLIAALLLSLLLAYSLSRRFVRPLQRMERLATKLAEGNYEARSSIHQEDEIGSLSQSLDTLASRLQEADSQRRKFLQLRQDFITNISHELRTPITVLRGTLELISSGLVTDEEKLQGYQKQMMANLMSLQRLVNDLFELSRLQNTDFSIEKSPLNLGDALMDAVQSASHLAKTKSIALRLPEPPFLFPMEGDYDRLRQMFLTILDNAVKFSPAHSSIDISAETAEGGWRISIADQGRGIAADELPHIFRRFHSRKNTENPNGTGLGLPIAWEIARRHEITLQCCNREEGGACFSFFQRKSSSVADAAQKTER